MYNKLRRVFTLVLGLTVVGLFNTASADWSIGDTEQDIVITLKSNPMSNPEAACLAVTFAKSLSGNPMANVTLFVTLDGVSLADDAVVSSRRFKCDTPWGEKTLIETLQDFLGGDDNNMVVCPLCWGSRYGDELPDHGVLPGSDDGTPGDAIGKMIFKADKILDF
ncbi:MAG: hypothetical protein GQ546_03800 [Gammaproteobacteria bacterium]|nr:hypothetical protein [Gammaproteobacteria bacterium]